MKTLSPPLRILIAEDNEVNLKVIKIILANCGWQFDIAQDGNEAVEKYNSERYDLVLMDCQMPRMDGIEATNRIRQIETLAQMSRTPIVAMTANAMKGDREKCLAAGMDDFLSKPFKSQEFKTKISEWTRKQGGDQ